MKNQALAVSILFGIAILFLILYFGAVQYNKINQKTRYGKEHPNDWLFHQFHYKVYGACFGVRDPNEVAVKLGIEIEKYYQSCRITRTIPEPEKLIVNHLYGVAWLILFSICGFAFHLILLLFGLLGFVYFVFYDQKRLDQKAEEMRLQIEGELPRFLDLLKPELEIGLPIESAIYIICSKFDSLLSRELLIALQEMKLGLSGWDQAVERVAQKYNVEILNEFAMDVTTSYRKGVPITQSVARKTKDIKQMQLLNIKERAAKANNTVLVPIFVFQFIPMIAYIVLPIMVQAVQGL